MLREHDDIMDDYEDRLLRLARLAPVESGVGTVSRQRKLSGQFKMSTRLGAVSYTHLTLPTIHSV